MSKPEFQWINGRLVNEDGWATSDGGREGLFYEEKSRKYWAEWIYDPTSKTSLIGLYRYCWDAPFDNERISHAEIIVIVERICLALRFKGETRFKVTLPNEEEIIL